MKPNRLRDIWSEGCPEDDFDAIMPTSKGVVKERRERRENGKGSIMIEKWMGDILFVVK
jgi:hypothetical protein